MNVTNSLTLYEVNGQDTEINRQDVMYVNSHWSSSAKIVLKIETVEVTVLASDLRKAIENATNQ